MRNLLLAAGVAAVLGISVGCGGDDHPPTESPDGGKGGSKGTPIAGSKATGGDSTAGGEVGAGGGASIDGPMVRITSPETVTEPSEGVLSEPVVKVTCKVEAGASGAEIDQTSVELTLLDHEGTELQKKQGASTGNADEYETDFVLETVPSGKVSFRCSALDAEKQLGAHDIVAFVDHGPTITIVSPEPDSAHPLIGGLPVEFTVEPTELAAGDAGAAVGDVSFILDDRNIELDEVSPGKYQATVLLDDLDLFPVTPSGVIAITATNGRPTPVAATENYHIVIDGAGPVITFESPPPLKVVGGKVTLVFKVADTGSGVDPLSVNIKLAQGDPLLRFYDPDKGWANNGERYSYTFDTKEVELFAKTQMTINVRAEDRAGNPSETGQSLQLYLDNVPPEVDLDPLNVRMLLGTKCTGAFDPVGAAAVNDLDGVLGEPLVTRIAYFRTLIRARTNSEPGQTIFFHALLDQTQVRIYAQADPDNASINLLVNKNPNEDDTCDEIGGINDINTAPLFTAVKPLPKSGTGRLRYVNDPAEQPLIGNTCTLEAGAPTDTECGNLSDLQYVPVDVQLGNEPMVYAVAPVPNSVACTGVDWSFVGQNQPEGWVCLAARAIDTAGNVGISPPVRVCVDDPATQYEPPCRTSSTVPPTCTDGCTPPPRGGNLIIRTN